MAATTSSAEFAFLAAIVANLADDQPKLIYADWLEDQSDRRCEFLRKFVAAAKTLKPGDFPDPNFMGPGNYISEEWLQLIGFRLLERAIRAGHPEIKDLILRLARPALTIFEEDAREATDDDIPVGASKIGGLPDLPAGFAWPPGGDCHAIYNDDTGGTKRLAGFLAQINLAELAHTQAGALLPKVGLLSFFCFQDMEHVNPDAIGAKAILFSDVSNLVRTEPPEELMPGNEILGVWRFEFAEFLDLPYGSQYTRADSGPWGEEIAPFAAAYGALYENMHSDYMENILGYGRATSGDDPTPNKDSRHLIVLDNAAECRLHIQIPAKELAARNFDAITLNWVDFD